VAARPKSHNNTAEALVTERDRLPVVALIAANLIPLVGIFLFDWDVRYLLLLYWLENLVVGAFTAIRMFSVGGIGALPMVLFFSFHYSFFCGGHGMILLGVTSLAGPESHEAPFQESGIPFLIPLELLGNTLAWIKLNMPDLLFVPLLAMVLSHGVSLIKHHWLGQEDEGRKAQDIMSDPYRRIFVLHLAIIAGSFFIVSTGGGSAAPMLALLVGGKIWLDLHLHRKAHLDRHRKVASTDPDRAL
jgi:hypothetical protein